MTEEIKYIEEQPKDNCDGCRNKDCLQCPTIPEVKKKQLLEEMRNLTIEDNTDLVREEYRDLIERLEIDRDTYKHEVEVMKKNCKHNIDVLGGKTMSDKGIEYKPMADEVKEIISDHITGGNDIKENFTNFYSLNKNLKESFEEIKKLLLDIKDTQGVIPCSNDSQCVCNDFDLIIDDIEILEAKFYD